MISISRLLKWIQRLFLFGTYTIAIGLALKVNSAFQLPLVSFFLISCGFHVLQMILNRRHRQEPLASIPFRDFFESNTSVMLIIRPNDGSILKANASACRFYGYSPNEFLLLKITDINILGPNRVQEAQERVRLGMDHEFEFKHRLKSGEIRDVIVKPSYLYTDTHSLILSVINDVTDKKAMERHLLQQQRDTLMQRAFLQKTIDKMPALIGYWDDQLENRLANKLYHEFYNLTPDTIRGMHIKDVIGPAYEKNLPFIQNALNGHDQTFERTIPTPNGLKYTLARYIPDIENDRILGFFVLVSDITELKTLQELEKQNQAQLVMKSKLASLGEMAAGIAHEINNPLAIIIGKTNILLNVFKKKDLNPEDFEKIPAALETIAKTSQRIALIIKGLRSFSRDTEKDPFERVKVRQLIDEVLSLTSERIRSHGIDLLYNENDSDFDIFCNRIQIGQVLINLISNSIYALSKIEHPWIQIQVEKINAHIMIRISDSGRGIPDATVEKMMNPFFTTKPVGDGTGLGLSISKGLLERHHGELKYELFQGHTSFIITIPVKSTGITDSAA